MLVDHKQYDSWKYVKSHEAKLFETETSDGMCGCDVMCILSIDEAEVGQADTCPEVAH